MSGELVMVFNRDFESFEKFAKPEGDYDTGDNNDARIAEETRRKDPFLHVLDASDGRLFRSINGNDDGADDTVETTDFSDETEAFFQEYLGQNGANDDRQCTHGRDKNGIGKGICDEITTRY